MQKPIRKTTRTKVAASVASFPIPPSAVVGGFVVVSLSWSTIVVLNPSFIVKGDTCDSIFTCTPFLAKMVCVDVLRMWMAFLNGVRIQGTLEKYRLHRLD
jgi:hypothetical protein